MQQPTTPDCRCTIHYTKIKKKITYALWFWVLREPAAGSEAGARRRTKSPLQTSSSLPFPLLYPLLLSYTCELKNTVYYSVVNPLSFPPPTRFFSLPGKRPQTCNTAQLSNTACTPCLKRPRASSLGVAMSAAGSRKSIPE